MRPSPPSAAARPERARLGRSGRGGFGRGAAVSVGARRLRSGRGGFGRGGAAELDRARRAVAQPRRSHAAALNRRREGSADPHPLPQRAKRAWVDGRCTARSAAAAPPACKTPAPPVSCTTAGMTASRPVADRPAPATRSIAAGPAGGRRVLRFSGPSGCRTRPGVPRAAPAGRRPRQRPKRARCAAARRAGVAAAPVRRLRPSSRRALAGPAPRAGCRWTTDSRMRSVASRRAAVGRTATQADCGAGGGGAALRRARHHDPHPSARFAGLQRPLLAARGGTAGSRRSHGGLTARPFPRRCPQNKETPPRRGVLLSKSLIYW